MNNQSFLVVDDDEFFREMISSLLIKLGKEVVISESGEEALTIVKANPHKFGTIITDFKMPGITGVELIKEISTLNAPISKFILASSMVGLDESIDELCKKEKKVAAVEKVTDMKEFLFVLQKEINC